MIFKDQPPKGGFFAGDDDNGQKDIGNSNSECGVASD